MSITTINNIRIFDGMKVLENQSRISFDSSTGLIVPETDAATIIDGSGCTLIPGVWDTHVHLSNPTPQSVPDSIARCKDMIACGITTTVDCGKLNKDDYETLQNEPIAPNILYVNNFATSTGSTHSRFAMADASSIVDSVEDAITFVKERVKQGAHYIKIVADVPGPSQAVINQLSKSAAQHGKMTIVHASRHAAFMMALRAEPPVSVITHVPLDSPLSQEEAKMMGRKGIVSVPTLIMMKTISGFGYIPGISFSTAMESTKALLEADVPLLVGTDSNQSQVASVNHGEAVWQEMELLQEVGLTPAEVLRAGTALSARLLGAVDRGELQVGKRADMVLVKGNPDTDLHHLRRVVRVWKAGKDIFRDASSESSLVSGFGFEKKK